MKDNTNILPAGYILQSPLYEYRIVSVIGHGGFGITYQATTKIKVGNLNVTVSVAIKEHFMSDDCERDVTNSHVVYSNPARKRVEDARHDFISEAKRLYNVGSKHSNIVKVNEVFEANNTAYYVMEYIDGASLRSYVKRKGGISQREMWMVMTPIIDAVNFMHRNHMTHLDIKPDNIMISHDEQGNVRPVLIDFGLSKHYDRNGSPTSTIKTQGCSDGYSPIEQYAGISSFSPSADIYALGATMWFCLTGRDPQKSTDLVEGQLVEGLPADISDDTYQAIAGALHMSRNDRVMPVPPAAHQPNEKIENDDKTSDITTRVLDNTGNKRNISLPRWSIYLGIALVALLIGIGLFIWLRSSDETEHRRSYYDDTDDEEYVEAVAPGNEWEIISIPGDSSSVSFNMRRVDGGTFMMGNPNGPSDEQPAHEEYISTFYISQTEVTKGQWYIVLGEWASSNDYAWDNPVESVSYHDCMRFIDRLNQITGRRFRLPTEAEWEYAARGGNQSAGYDYNDSQYIHSVAWNTSNGGKQIHPVAELGPNELGLYDMLGNVAEWTSSGYTESYELLPSSDYLVFRGGSSYNDPSTITPTYRGSSEPSSTYCDLGFRIVLDD